MHPTQPIMYATIPSHNSIAIINTNTLAASTVFVGSNPVNLALSPDGLRAYIANSTTNFVVVFNTQTRTVVNSFVLPEHPQDVVFGNQNRLWVLGENQIFQIDAVTGASTGPSISGYNGGVFIYSGSLEISPDRNTLYYGDYGLSPATMYKINVSGSTPVLVRQTPFGTGGENGEDLTLSHNGSFICYTTGAGQNLYDIAKFRTSDFASLGSFVTGPYPTATGISPDDAVVYASVSTASGIKVFNANTFTQSGFISGPEVASKLAVDSTGRYLFAGYNVYFGDFLGTIVFDTGRGAAPGATMIWYLNDNVFTNAASSPTVPSGWQIVGVGDFNSDGHPDYLFYNASNRRTVIWYMNDNVRLSSHYGPTLPSGWRVVGVGDFNRDGHSDYLLFNPITHQAAFWYLVGVTLNAHTAGPHLPSDWQVVATNDFNMNGYPDLVLYNVTTHQTVVWYMHNNLHVGSATGPTVPGGWSVVGTADFNGDGHPDYLLFRPSTGQSVIWYMSGATHTSSRSGPTIDAGWNVAGVADFNGNGDPDYLLFNAGL